MLEKKRAVGYLATSTNCCKDLVDLGLITSFPNASLVLNKKQSKKRREKKKRKKTEHEL